MDTIIIVSIALFLLVLFLIKTVRKKPQDRVKRVVKSTGKGLMPEKYTAIGDRGTRYAKFAAALARKGAKMMAKIRLPSASESLKILRIAIPATVGVMVVGVILKSLLISWLGVILFMLLTRFKTLLTCDHHVRFIFRGMPWPQAFTLLTGLWIIIYLI